MLRGDTMQECLVEAAGLPETGIRLLDRREEETWLPWGHILERARVVGGGLRALGIGVGERVALVYPTSEDFLVAFFGALWAGAVPVPLYPPVRLGRLDEYHRSTAGMLGAASARLVLADRLVRRVLGEAIERAAPAHGCLVLDELPPATAAAAPTAGPEDLALVQFSSGTTVDPKPVALSHRALVEQARTINRLWPDPPGGTHTGLSWLPLYHDMGLIGFVIAGLIRPTVVTLLPPEAFVARPALWLRAIGRYRATVSAAPNFAYGLATARVRDEEMEGVDLSSWTVALNGAESIAPTTLRAFSDRFARWGFRPEAMTPVYGLSEAALGVAFSPLGRLPRIESFDRRDLAQRGVATRRGAASGGTPAAAALELVSVGSPLPGFSIEIRDAAGRPVAGGRTGRIWVRGPSLMTAYLDRPEATADAIRDGWLDTGDLGFFHDGELFLTGRAKDVLILRGRNHAPEEVEQAVIGLPGVRGQAVIAASDLPSGAEGEELVLFVEVARGTAAAQRKALAQRARDAVLAATGLQVDRVALQAPGTLPRTSSGKLRRSEALRRFRAGELDAPAPANAWTLGGALWRSRRAFARLGRERVPEAPAADTE